ncbi:MAG TPA: hypothetical protein VNL77_08830 [Roseiflexaceae bacterium]|nr:hypothetical protein [Roseiflexaceae bacterium]
MRRTNTTTLAGAALVALGTLSLLQSLGLLGPLAGLLWAGAFAAGGLAFLAAFLRSPSAWWAAIPGSALLGLAAVTGVGTLAPWAAGGWTGGLFLGAIGLGFCLVYLAHRDSWWAVLPAGVLLTLATVAGLSDIVGEAAGALFFFGLAATFGALTRLPEIGGRLRWALVPAGVMLAMGVVVLLTTSQLFSILLPAALILAGLAILYRGGMVMRHGGNER